MSVYQDFLATKAARHVASGHEVEDSAVHPMLFPFQRDLVRWSIRKGRAAIFADTGMGKTLMQLEWARLTEQPTLIVAPLSVARQTIREGQKIGLEVDYARQHPLLPEGLTITNYEMVDHFNPDEFGAVVLDESSILKSFDGKTRTKLIEMFAGVPYRLCCTATPAPNDIGELANHAEFLGLCSRVEMLSQYFVHDQDGWRLKGHAEQPFYKWLASWGMSLKRPSDLGYSDDGYVLPGLNIESLIVSTDYAPEGQLFPTVLKGIGDRAAVRRSTLMDRVEAAAELIWRSWDCERPKTIESTCELITKPTRANGTGARQKSANGATPPEESDTKTIQSSESSARPHRGQGTNVQSEADDCLASSGSPQTNTMLSWNSSKGDALSAEETPATGGREDSTLTTAMPPEESEVCSAQNAILRSASSKTIQKSSDEPWIIWCGLNDEQDAIAKLLGDRCVSVHGGLSPEEKARLTELWTDGHVPVMVTKPTVLGYGMNFQHCARMVFVGLSDSYEQYYQCIRRCYRYGQTRPVDVRIVLTEVEETVLANVMRKEEEAERVSRELIKHVAEFERAEMGVKEERFVYQTRDERGDDWTLYLGDSVERLKEIPDESIDLSVFSPPFQSLFVYSPTERDLGNSRNADDFWQHFRFIMDELLRVTKPGRNVAVHVSQLPTTLATHGEIGLADFRGETIRHFQAAGFVYHGDVCIDKNPQSQAIRTHAKGLLFAQLRRDSSWLRPGLADFIEVFRKPGDNAVSIHPDITNDEWIEWAHPVWYGIRETDTLNVVEARSDKDERHICPLQLGTIERCVRLWSNKGETVLSPFAGIGSEGYQSLKLGRRFVGVELKPEYFNVAVRNLQRCEAEKQELTLFSVHTSQPEVERISGSTGADLLSGTPVQVALNTPALTTPRGRRAGAVK